MRPRLNARRWRTAILRSGLLALSLLASGSTAAAQGARPAGESAGLAQGWTMVSKGQTEAAATLAADLLERYPRSSAVLALAIDAAMARAGSTAGLDVYERWLANRSAEDGFTLRRVAAAHLREAARDDRLKLVKFRAAEALAADGDQEFAAAMGRNAGGQGPADDPAIDSLLSALSSPMPNKAAVIAGLTQTASPRATAPLIGLLGDPDPVTRAAAADALGTLGATAAIPQLKTLLNDPVFPVHLSAAAALLALKDTTGLPWLRQLQSSEHAGVRLAAVQASRTQPDQVWLDTVRALSAEADPEIRRPAAVLLAPHDPAAARAILEPMLADPNPAQREAAAASFLGDVVSDFPTLRKSLRDPDPGTRVQAASRILRLTR